MRTDDRSIVPDSTTVAAVVLAAGLSTRMGQFKPLLPLGGAPMVARVVESIQSVGGIGPVVVVTGHQSERVRSALADLDVRFAYNEAYEQGEMLSSVQAGVRALPTDAGAFVLALGDQPVVKPSTIRLLADTWRRTGALIVAPTYEGRRGHPIVFSSRCIPELLALHSNQTLKALLDRDPNEIAQVPVDDPAVRVDIDTPQDYECVLRVWQRRSQRREAMEAIMDHPDQGKPDSTRSGLSRRGFLKGAGVSAASTVLLDGTLAGIAEAQAKAGEPRVTGPGAVALTLRINGKDHRVEAEPRATLAQVLRDELDLTGTKVVCDRGACSACTVFLDGTPVCSCMTLAIDVGRRQVKTIEGLADGEELHPVQAAFIEHDALQCGFCTPGMLMSCAGLLERNSNPTFGDVRNAVRGNLCRCGTYPKVFDATLAAAKAMAHKKGA